jgi:hypothetical protein
VVRPGPERRHRVEKLGVAAVERSGDVGDLELARDPEQGSCDILEAPGISADLDPGPGRREPSLQFAAALEKMERTGEVRLAADAEVHLLEKDFLLDWKVDARAHVVEHLRPMREVDVSGDRAGRPFTGQIDAIEDHLSAVDLERGLQVGAERPIRLNRDRAIRKLRGAAVGIEPFPDRHVQIARDRAPRCGVILVGELPIAGDDRSHRRHEPLWSLRPFRLRDNPGEVVAAPELLDQHLPVAHVHVADDQLLVEDGPPGHVHRDPLRLEKRAVSRLEAFDDQVFDDECPGREADTELANVHWPLEIVGPGALRASTQRRAEVDRQRRNDERGGKRNENAEDTDDRMPATLSRRWVRSRLGLRRLLRDDGILVHWAFIQ